MARRTVAPGDDTETRRSAPWRGRLTLVLLPFWLFWWVWVLVPCWVLAGLIRYYRAPLRVRERRWRIEHSSRTRFWSQHERKTAELLRRRGLLDTPENRAKLRR